MDYWWRTFSSRGVLTEEDSVIFPQAQWPTPRDMNFMGNATNPGFGGMYYVYGPDNIVSLIQQLSTSSSPFCPLNTKWRVVNVGSSSSKRSISGKDKDNRSYNDKNTEVNIKSKWDEYKKKGNNDTAAWTQLVDWDCQNTPKIELTAQLEDWISMTGLAPELWDRVCDSVSQKWATKHGGKNNNSQNH